MARVLLADDDPALRELVSDLLERGGHEPVCARDGDEALQRFEAGRPDAVLLDLFMPGREGLETLLEMQRLDPDVPVVVMSGTAQRHLLTVARHLGAAGTLPKPFDRRALERALQQAGVPAAQP